MCGKYPSATEDPCWSLEDRLWALLKHNNLVLIQFYVILKTFLVLTHFCKHLPSFGGTGNIPATSAGQWVTHTSTFWWGSFKTHIRQKGVSQKKTKQLALTKGYLNHPRAVQMLDRERWRMVLNQIHLVASSPCNIAAKRGNGETQAE
jgi:hypothetical protein